MFNLVLLYLSEYTISSPLYWYWYSSVLSCSYPINKFKSSKLSEWVLMSISIMKECYIPMWCWLELMPLCVCLLFILRWNQIVCSNCLCGYSQTRWLDNESIIVCIKLNACVVCALAYLNIVFSELLWQLCLTLNQLSCKLLLQSTIPRQVLFINCEWHSHLQAHATYFVVFASQVQWRLIRFLFSFGVWSSCPFNNFSLSVWSREAWLIYEIFYKYYHNLREGEGQIAS